MSSERKRSWDGDLDDEDEILGTKKGKIEIDDEDALLLNDDEDDDLLRDSDTEDQKESIKSNGDSDKLELKQKVRHNSTKSISTNDEANFEDELDYDEDFSDDENGKKRERFKNERSEADVVVKKAPVDDSNKKEIPDTLEVTPEVQEKIAKFDEDKKKQRAKKFAPQIVKNGTVPKSGAPPVIRYGGPPPHIPAPMARMPPLHVTGPPPQVNIFPQLPGGKKILVNPKFRNKVNPTVSQPIPAIAPPIYRAPPPSIYSAPPPGFSRPPFSMPPGAPPPPGSHMPPSMVGVPPPMMPPRPFK